MEASKALAFAKAFVTDSGLRARFHTSPDNAVQEFGLSGELANAIKALLTHSSVETSDGAAVLRIDTGKDATASGNPPIAPRVGLSMPSSWPQQFALSRRQLGPCLV